MKMIKATNPQDISLEGVNVQLQQINGKVEAVIITDSTGKYIRIVKDGAYSETLKVLIEEPKKYQTVYKLTVSIDDGVSVYKFDSKEKLDNKINSLYLNEDDYHVQEIQVEVDSDLNGLSLVPDLTIPF